MKTKGELPLVSVVIPAFRAMDTLPTTIKSLLAEGQHIYKIYVIEDGVFDETKSVVFDFPKIELIQLEKNRGGSFARNIGLKNVVTPYVFFIDADDKIEGGLIRGMLDCIEAYKADVCFGPCKVVSGKKVTFVNAEPEDETVRYNVARRWLTGKYGPGTCAVLWRSHSIRSIGGWDEDLSRNQDGDLMIRASLSGLKFCISYEGAGLYLKNASTSVSKSVNDSAFRSLERVGLKAEVQIAALSQTDELKFSLKIYWALLSLLAFRERRDELAQRYFQYFDRKALEQAEMHWSLRFLIRVLGIRYGSIFWETLRRLKRTLI